MAVVYELRHLAHTYIKKPPHHLLVAEPKTSIHILSSSPRLARRCLPTPPLHHKKWHPTTALRDPIRSSQTLLPSPPWQAKEEIIAPIGIRAHQGPY
jgi:hypothetical protein